MKAILPVLLALSITTGLASRVIAAANVMRAPYAAAVAVSDDPAFGSPQWWDQQSDRG